MRKLEIPDFVEMLPKLLINVERKVVGFAYVMVVQRGRFNSVVIQTLLNLVILDLV